jgi:outer membrane protein assembly factor BamA
MRILVGVLSVSALINLALAQPAPSDAKIKIHQLIIEAKNLPDDDKERVVHLLQQNTYFENELETRVQMSLRDLGYFKAQVDDPKISIIGQSQETKDADVSVKVEQGAQYRLGEISFPHANVFPHDQMRSLFHLQSGDLFVSTAISLGLDRLRNLYATRGYINAVASPAVRADESSHTIDLIIDVDGGKPYDFGRLFLNGTSSRCWKGADGILEDPAGQAVQPRSAEDLASGERLFVARCGGLTLGPHRPTTTI